jgi:enoyl-CoA hydratase
MDELIVKTPASGVLQLHLNRPDQLNALSESLLTALSEQLSEASTNDDVKVILLTGEGKAFCAGADINQLAELDAVNGVEFARYGQAVFSQLEECGKPSIAAVHGYVFGGGCELSMAATLRIAANNTVFGQPEIKLGVIPGFGGTQRLTRLVGKGRALQWCLTGEHVAANVAHAAGLVNELVDPTQLQTRALALATSLAAQSPTAMQSILRAIHQGADLTMKDALDLESLYFGLCCATNDKDEGVAAFLEKRQPVFSGA